MPATLSGFSAAQLVTHRPPRLRPSRHGRAAKPRRVGQLAVERGEELAALRAAVGLAHVDPRHGDPRGEELLVHPLLVRVG